MSIQTTHDTKANGAEQFEYATIDETRINVRNVARDTIYTVSMTTDGSCALSCTCPDYKDCHADTVGGKCKHMAGVEDNLDRIHNDQVDTGGEPEITYHVEPAKQGGARYARCERCGNESVFSAESIVHGDGCYW